MRTGAKFLTLSALFSGVIGVVYWFVSYEPAGSALLASMAVAPLIAAVYVFVRNRDEPAPEDRDDADPGDGAGRYASLPSASPWPPLLALGFGLGGGGLIYGRWLLLLGLLVCVVAVIGLMRESES